MILNLLFVSLAWAGSPIKGSSFPMEHIRNLRPVMQPQGQPPDISGKVVLLDFWATWCEPCKKAIPAYAKLEKKFSKRGFMAIGVNLDDSHDEAREFLKRTPAGFTQLYGGQTTAVNVELESVPIMYLLDRKGVVQYVHRGFKSGEEIEIEKHIEKWIAVK